MMKTIREGECMPFFYGKIQPAYYMLGGYETALIPINYLYKFWHWILRKSMPKKWELKIQDIKHNASKRGYNKGYEDGQKQLNESRYQEGFNKGKVFGYDFAHKQLNECLDKKRK